MSKKSFVPVTFGDALHHQRSLAKREAGSLRAREWETAGEASRKRSKS
jgi:hypothetical protein